PPAEGTGGAGASRSASARRSDAMRARRRPWSRRRSARASASRCRRMVETSWAKSSYGGNIDPNLLSGVRLFDEPRLFEDYRIERCLGKTSGHRAAIISRDSSMTIENINQPRVVDVSRPGQALTIEIDASEAAELLLSIATLNGDKDRDTLELGRSRVESL